MVKLKSMTGRHSLKSLVVLFWSLLKLRQLTEFIIYYAYIQVRQLIIVLPSHRHIGRTHELLSPASQTLGDSPLSRHQYHTMSHTTTQDWLETQPLWLDSPHYATSCDLTQYLDQGTHQQPWLFCSYLLLNSINKTQLIFQSPSLFHIFKPSHEI